MRKILCAVMGVAFCSAALAGERFADQVGPIPVGEVDASGVIRVPCITWGGEAGLFVANGGLKTTPDSIYGKMGLNFEIVLQNDPVEQTKKYISGESPFWRGTFRMGGIAAEKMAEDPRTRGVVVLHMTYSAGDHIVAKKEIRTISDLKDTTGCMQSNGPHIGLTDDVLATANLPYDEVNIKWYPNLTGKDSPPEAFRNGECDWATVISPDMAGLTGGLQSTGTGAEGTVKWAHVLVSTAELSRSIADIIIVRADFKEKHPKIVDKFVAGYLKGCELVVDWRNAYEKRGSTEYEALLQTLQDVFGADVLPTLEEDAHGLVLDARFVGQPGQIEFFKNPSNLTGFAAFAKASANLAVSRGYATKRVELLPPGFDYKALASTGSLTKLAGKSGDRFDGEAVREEIESFSLGALDDRTVYSFSISFQPNQRVFPIDEIRTELRKAINMSAKFGNAVVALRAHADPSATLIALVRAGIKKGVLKRTGGPNWIYTLREIDSEGNKGKWRPMDLSSTSELIGLIEAGHFDGVAGHNPREIMQAALNLSRQRADAVKAATIACAKQDGLALDASQFQPVGVGIREPFIPVPRDDLLPSGEPDPNGMKAFEKALLNMRVEFRLVRVDAEMTQSSDFDF